MFMWFLEILSSVSHWSTMIYDEPLLKTWFFVTGSSKKMHLLDSHLHHHSASERHNIKDRRMNKRRMIKTQEGRRRKASLQIYFTSHFIARVRKGCSRVACERELETEHKLHILTPLLWPSRCVFLVLLILGSTLSGVFRGPPSVGCGFPYHIWSLAVWNSTGNCFGTPNSTELNNNSTPTRSPTGSLKSDV